jgi:Nitrous oxide-stimulated promoter.
MLRVLLDRIEREKTTIRAMIMIYCSDNHGRKHVLCAECAKLKEYALLRLDKCPFGDTKPTCVNCLVHCYHPNMRERVKQVMRYAGPRMLLRHPVLAIFHLIDGHLYKPKSKADIKPRSRSSVKQKPAPGVNFNV